MSVKKPAVRVIGNHASPSMIPLPSKHPVEDAPVPSSSFSFPSSHQLVVTTSKGVHYWSHHSVKEVFKSGSEGIVAAKKTSGEENLLAVADSQVVILHDTQKGMQQTYRLKRAEQV